MTTVTDYSSESIPLSTMKKATTTRWGCSTPWVILWVIQQYARQETKNANYLRKREEIAQKTTITTPKAFKKGKFVEKTSRLRK